MHKWIIARRATAALDPLSLRLYDRFYIFGSKRKKATQMPRGCIQGPNPQRAIAKAPEGRVQAQKGPSGLYTPTRGPALLLYGPLRHLCACMGIPARGGSLKARGKKAGLGKACYPVVGGGAPRLPGIQSGIYSPVLHPPDGHMYVILVLYSDAITVYHHNGVMALCPNVGTSLLGSPASVTRSVKE